MKISHDTAVAMCATYDATLDKVLSKAEKRLSYVSAAIRDQAVRYADRAVAATHGHKMADLFS